MDKTKIQLLEKENEILKEGLNKILFTDINPSNPIDSIVFIRIAANTLQKVRLLQRDNNDK